MIAADDYLTELRRQLAARYWPTPRVRDAVDEARRHLHETGEAPVDAFGQPADYADALDAAWRPRDRPLPVRVVAAIAVALLAGAAGTLVGGLLAMEGGLEGSVEVPLVQPVALAAACFVPVVITRVRRRSGGTKAFLIAAALIGGVAGVVGGVLQSLGVGLQLSAPLAIVLACTCVLASIGIGALFFGAPWRSRRRAHRSPGGSR
jgi:hypothetical protein